MADVEITRKGKRWYVLRNGDFVGRYNTEDEAREAGEIARYSDTWTPLPDVPEVPQDE